MKTIGELIALSADFLKSKSIGDSRRAAEELIADSLALGRLDLYLSHDRPLEDVEVEKIRQRLSRRAKGEPWQYITGQIDFYGCKIKVDSRALIPRQETEILVDAIVKELQATSLENRTLLDLCTGSGCIGLALKKRFPMLRVILSDISSQALQLAAENALANELSVELQQGDFLEGLDAFDYIVCNPPYVSEKSYSDLDPSVKNYEPRSALEAKDDGFEFYNRFEKEGMRHLRKKAWFEIGCDQGEQLLRQFCKAPWKNAKVEKDWSSQDRFFSLEIE